ncbi:hypothetical protein LXL04_030402 [Taraxacum kok-saghyz]
MKTKEVRRYSPLKEDSIGGTATTFFFTNFPEHWAVARLSEAFSRLGKVADVFVARKRSSQGRKFGFVRFFKVMCMEKMVEDLNNLWMEKFKIRANVAKYRRKENKPRYMGNSVNQVFQGRLKSIIVKEKNVEGTEGWATEAQLRGSSPASHRRSYAEAVRGASPSIPCQDKTRETETKETEENVIVVLPTKEVKERMDRTLVGEVQSFDLLRNFHSFTKVEGIDNVEVSFIGGLFVTLEFRSKTAAGEYLKKSKEAWSSWFKRLQPSEPNFQIQSRLVSVHFGHPPAGLEEGNLLRCGVYLGGSHHSGMVPHRSPKETQRKSSNPNVVVQIYNENVEMVIDKHRFKILVVEDMAESDKLLPVPLPDEHGFVNDGDSETGDSEESFCGGEFGPNDGENVSATVVEINNFTAENNSPQPTGPPVVSEPFLGSFRQTPQPAQSQIRSDQKINPSNDREILNTGLESDSEDCYSKIGEEPELSVLCLERKADRRRKNKRDLKMKKLHSPCRCIIKIKRNGEGCRHSHLAGKTKNEAFTIPREEDGSSDSELLIYSSNVRIKNEIRSQSYEATKNSAQSIGKETEALETMGEALGFHFGGIQDQVQVAAANLVLSLNINGARLGHKRKWVKDLVHKHKIQILCLQETKSNMLNDYDVNAMWGRRNRDLIVYRDS